MSRRSLIKGALILSITGIIAKFLGFFFRIPLIYLIGEEGIGIYQITYPLYSFLLALASGLPIAISKLISERLALKRNKEAVEIFKIAFYIMLIFGLTSSITLIIFAEFFIEVFNWSKGVYYSILAIAFAPFFTSLLSVYRGYFQGIQNMFPSGASQIIEQIARVLFGVGLAYLLLPLGIEIAAAGAAFGAVSGAMLGLLFILFFYRKNAIYYNKNEDSQSKAKLLYEIIKVGIPVSIAHGLGTIMALIDSILVVGLLKSSGFDEKMATILYGQLTGKAFVLVNVPLTLSMAIAQSTVPAISETFALKNKINLFRNINLSYKLAFSIALPSSFGLYFLARPIINLIFQGMGDGWQLLQILSIASAFIIFSQTSTSILNGIGKTTIPLIALMIGAIVKVVSLYILVPGKLNISGAAYSTLISYAVISIIDLTFVIKYTKVKFDLVEVVIKPLVCSLGMIYSVMATYLYAANNLGSNFATILSITIGILVYGFMLILTGTFKISDLRKIV
ncbi:Stage V sporulation protein B [Caloramator mitchellensis]|uniref:Stage V sporulation protein B n=1 Tax=Caloramator mitchellensis TaxID=908809 RepID=A0A0R3K0B8_CALMK|nr:polysaccharide biosynthesis protein [Caloramator mitchellensis]KRQ86684.1 Stage V sporulation protein B [Caloramator mitchellensis]